MNVLIVTFDPPENIGGVEGRLGGYVRELLKSGHFVEVESFSPAYGLSSVEFQEVRLHRLSSNLGRVPINLWLTLKRMRKSRIESVFLLSGGITFFGLLLMLYCRLTRRRSAMLLYGREVLQARKKFHGRLFLVFATRLADSVMTNSRFTGSLVPFVPPQKTRILYPGVDPAIAPPAVLSPAPFNRRVLFVGRLVRRKGLSDLIAAFKLLSEEFPDATLEVVGEGPERGKLERLVADLNLSERVSFLGSMVGPSLFQRYVNCSVFAMPSVTLADDAEGFGTVFLEAGLFEKPSVGTYSGGIPEAVVDKGTGLLVHEGQAEDIAMALRTLFTDANLSQSLGRNARERVLSRFTWAESTRQLIRCLRPDHGHALEGAYVGEV